MPEATPGAAVRTAAARAVNAVLAGTSLDAALETEQEPFAEADRGLLRALAYGVVRQQRLLQALLDRLLARPATTPPPVRALLLVGLLQLRSLRIPAHAAVSATVAASAPLGVTAARGLVNAVLRRYQREGQAIEQRLPQDTALRESYPDWLAARLRVEWGERWRQVLAAGNQPPPLTLRVNRRRIEREACLRRMCQAGAEAVAVAQAPQAIRLLEPRPVERIPGFREGWWSVQDAAAQLAAPLLDAQPGMRVLDACAAPGGKTAHLLETVDRLELLALDLDAHRQQRTRNNLQRLGLAAEVAVGDAAQPAAWWDGRPFQRILLDAPCSGSGVIRRHPDIKWLRRESDLPVLARRQRELLEALWPLLAPGGTLLYATCSILDAEGATVIAEFLGEHADAVESAIDADWGEPLHHGRRIAPGGDFDGFYYARLKKSFVA